MSSTQQVIEAIRAIIEEIKMLPPVFSTSNPTSPPQACPNDKHKPGRSRQSTSTSDSKPSVRTVAPGWGNFLEDIKKKDAETHQDRLAKSAAFAASGEKHTITEVYKERTART